MKRNTVFVFSCRWRGKTYISQEDWPSMQLDAGAQEPNMPKEKREWLTSPLPCVSSAGTDSGGRVLRWKKEQVYRVNAWGVMTKPSIEKESGLSRKTVTNNWIPKVILVTCVCMCAHACHKQRERKRDHWYIRASYKAPQTKSLCDRMCIFNIQTACSQSAKPLCLFPGAQTPQPSALITHGNHVAQFLVQSKHFM